jgi:hypothetical protein
VTLNPPSSVGNGLPLALPGATAATRYVGATASGAPASGTFAVGDFVIDQTGKVYVCTVAGSPGTWVQAGGSAGAELKYVEYTAPVVITATTDATAQSVVSAGAVTFDGSTVALIQFFAPAATVDTTAAIMVGNLYDGSTDLGRLWLANYVSAGGESVQPVSVFRRLTPSAAAHTYSVRCWCTSVASGSSDVQAGAGGTATLLPGFIRITQAS